MLLKGVVTRCKIVLLRLLFLLFSFSAIIEIERADGQTVRHQTVMRILCFFVRRKIAAGCWEKREERRGKGMSWAVSFHRHPELDSGSPEEMRLEKA